MTAALFLFFEQILNIRRSTCLAYLTFFPLVILSSTFPNFSVAIYFDNSFINHPAMLTLLASPWNRWQLYCWHISYFLH